MPSARNRAAMRSIPRSEEHTSELQSRSDLVCRLLLEKKKKKTKNRSKKNQSKFNPHNDLLTNNYQDTKNTFMRKPEQYTLYTSILRALVGLCTTTARHL